MTKTSPPKAPFIRKGGTNKFPSQVEKRPPPPQPIATTFDPDTTRKSSGVLGHELLEEIVSAVCDCAPGSAHIVAAKFREYEDALRAEHPDEEWKNATQPWAIP
jgi:hypothetical protein